MPTSSLAEQLASIAPFVGVPVRRPSGAQVPARTHRETRPSADLRASLGSARPRHAGAMISAETGRGSSRRESCARSEARAGGASMDGAVGELTTRDQPVADRPAVNFTTLAEAFRVTSADRAETIAIRTRGDEFTISWAELRRRVDDLAGGLARLGLGRGDTIALMLSNRPEFHICDLAAMMLGATPFSIYNTYAPNQIEYVVSDAGARVLICEQQYLPQVLEARRGLPQLEHLIVVDGDPPAGAIALSDVEGSNPDFDLEASIAQIKPTDVLTLIYTSGTTGPPKGVQLIHRNLLAACEGLEVLIDLPRDGRVISWLPA